MNQPPQTRSNQVTAPIAAKPSTIKKDPKKILKGVVVKKRTKHTVSPSVSGTKSKSAEKDDNAPPDSKRRKTDSSD